MVRSGGYDPRRIPASVFERTKCQAPTPVEWSITSTESLFSIHLGNINFLKEKFRPLVEDPQNPPQNPEELDKINGAITIRLPMQDKKASDSPISRQERSSQEQDDEASDGPISRLERNSHENENTAGVVNAVKLKQGNECGIIEEKTGDLIKEKPFVFVFLSKTRVPVDEDVLLLQSGMLLLGLALVPVDEDVLLLPSGVLLPGLAQVPVEEDVLLLQSSMLLLGLAKLSL
ncbi:hypothetical protein MLD38_007455 [Melastoma candidum]|nr:hypothetical protein MLD38_007455 [Melastoma candidum]